MCRPAATPGIEDIVFQLAHVPFPVLPATVNQHRFLAREHTDHPRRVHPQGSEPQVGAANEGTASERQEIEAAVQRTLGQDAASGRCGGGCNKRSLVLFPFLVLTAEAELAGHPAHAQ